MCVSKDLLKAIEDECTVRQGMKNKHLEDMQKTRLEYDVKMEKKRLEEEAIKAKSKDMGKSGNMKEEKSKKKDKNEIEPPIVNEETYIDVDEEYLVYEDDIALKERNLMGPEYLPLNENDVNMRQYQISGGIFKIDLLERPLQTEQINQQLFMRLNNVPNILQSVNFQHKYKPVTFVAKNDDRKSKIASLALDKEEKALGKLFKIEIKLFDKCCWWECPMVCRWEPWEESEEFEMLDDLTKDFNLYHEDNVIREQKKLFKSKEKRLSPKVLTIQDIDLSNIPEDFQLSHLFEDYLSSMLPDNFKVFYDELDTFEDKRKEWKKILQLQKEQQQEKFQSKSTTSNDDVVSLNEKLFQIDNLVTENKNSKELSAVTLLEFQKNYNESHVSPKSLFPKFGSVSLVLKTNTHAEQEVQYLREWIKNQKTAEEMNEIDMGEEKPTHGAPLLLSELLEKINIVKASNKTFFKESSEIKKSVTSVQPTNESSIMQMSDKFKSRRSTRSTMYKSLRPSLMHNRTSKTSVSRSSLPSRKSSTSSNTSIKRYTKKIKITTDSTVNVTEHLFYKKEHELKLIPHSKGKWRTKYIYNQSYDPETKVLTFYAGRLGTFGFATKKYFNCPFFSWELLPFVENKNDKFVMFYLVTSKVKLELKITESGYTFKIKEPGKTPVQEIVTPVKVFELKKVNLNIQN